MATHNQIARVLVVDDEPPARLRLVAMIDQFARFQVVAEAANGEQALSACAEHAPDIVLMDIRMPGMDGLQAATRLAVEDKPPAVIFCTAYEEHSLAAFEANAVGYLLKPVNKEKLQAALEKAGSLNRAQLTAISESLTGGHEGNNAYLLVRSAKGEERITVAEVRALVADAKYVSAYLDGREVLLDQSLKALEARYPAQFVRVHRNALVAPDYIVSLEKVAAEPNKGEPQLRVCLRGTDVKPLVSRRLAPSIRRLLRQ